MQKKIIISFNFFFHFFLVYWVWNIWPLSQLSYTGKTGLISETLHPFLSFSSFVLKLFVPIGKKSFTFHNLMVFIYIGTEPLGYTNYRSLNRYRARKSEEDLHKTSFFLLLKLLDKLYCRTLSGLNHFNGKILKYNLNIKKTNDFYISPPPPPKQNIFFFFFLFLNFFFFFFFFFFIQKVLQLFNAIQKFQTQSDN